MIDILMAVCNGEKFIKEQIDSIINQSYTDWKLIIHDDGSTDKTIKIIKMYIKKCPEKIFLVEDDIKTGGAKNNFYHLMKLSSADYIMFADQDDIWEEDKVELAYEEICKRENKFGKNTPILCHSDLIVVDSVLNVINDSFFDMQKLEGCKNSFSDLLIQNNITGCTMIINRSLLNKCKCMPEEAIMHDWWLGLIAAAFGKIGLISYKKIKYRQHGNNTEGAKNLKNPLYCLKKMFDKKGIIESLNIAYSQADAFYREYMDELSEQNADIIRAYLSMKNSKKIDKLRIIKKYRFMKSGFVRKISYLFFV